MADAKKKEEPTKPTPEEKLAAAEAEVDALVKKGLKALDEFEKLDQKQVDHIVAKASVAALNKHLVLAKMAVEETVVWSKTRPPRTSSPASMSPTTWLVRRPSASSARTTCWASTKSPSRLASSLA